jgi:transcriptional regulator with XRE-family HTH domain
MSSNQKIRTRLRSWREEAGLTLAEAAKELGFSKATLGPIEGGRLRPTRLVALRLEAHFGEPIGDLLKPAPKGAVPKLLRSDSVNQNANGS